MEIFATRLDGPLVIRPRVAADIRGFFQETYREDRLAEAGIHEHWVQDNHSRSARGVLRGMHFSLGGGQAKLVRCARGAIVDVVVDIRHGSPTWGEWEAVTLDDEQHWQLYIPVGFAHGFCVVTESADVIYKCSSYYDHELERGFAYDDPAVGIEWPGLDLVVSERDRNAPPLAAIATELPFEYVA
jgi:dTDP-4-dehydrorhamnose 3,5-epimerase